MPVSIYPLASIAVTYTDHWWFVIKLNFQFRLCRRDPRRHVRRGREPQQLDRLLLQSGAGAPPHRHSKYLHVELVNALKSKKKRQNISSERKLCSELCDKCRRCRRMDVINYARKIFLIDRRYLINISCRVTVTLIIYYVLYTRDIYCTVYLICLSY